METFGILKMLQKFWSPKTQNRLRRQRFFRTAGQKIRALHDDKGMLYIRAQKN
jgi:hypothetical protein